MSYQINVDKNGKYTLPTKNTRVNEDIEFIVDVGLNENDIKFYHGGFILDSAQSTFTLSVGHALPEKFYFQAQCSDQSLTTNQPDRMNVYKFTRYYDGTNEIEYNSISGQAATAVLPTAITANGVLIHLNAAQSSAIRPEMRAGSWSWVLVEVT